MIYVTGKKMVVTRKEHTCYACNETIFKKENAIMLIASEDDLYKKIRLCLSCNVRFKTDYTDLSQGMFGANAATFKPVRIYAIDDDSDIPF